MVQELTTELGILTCLCVLAAMLWMPYIIGVSKDPVGSDSFTRPTELSKLQPWVHRSHRAHLNLLEQLLPFAILVLIMDRVDGYSALTFWTSIVFFWLRVAHAIGMISGLAKMPVRPILFTGGWICCLLMAYAVWTA